MKKYIFIFFAFIYLIVTSGFTINYHYCGGKLKKASFASNNEKGCCCNKKQSKGCCKDIHSFFKVKDNHKLSNSTSLQNTKFNTIEATFTTQIFSFASQLCNLQTLNYHSPPVDYGKPLYLVNKVILI